MWERYAEVSTGRVQWVEKNVRRDLRQKSSNKSERKIYKRVVSLSMMFDLRELFCSFTVNLTDIIYFDCKADLSVNL